MSSWKHLIWLVYGAALGFGTSFIFADLLVLPVDLYYLIYVTVVLGFFTIYIRRTGLDLGRWFGRRLWWGLGLGAVVAFLMVQNVLSRPATDQLSGGMLVWAVLWRGLVYGTVDGLLLTVFPWVVTWRAFDGESKPRLEKVGLGLLAWLFVVFMTSAYHLGYSDFRSNKLAQANVGNTLMSVPTLVAANPVGTPIAHAALHVSAVIHSPQTDLYLPPHR